MKLKQIKTYFFLLFFLSLNTLLFSNDYIVRKGDSLSIIAEKELGSKERWDEIASLNNIKPPYTIKLKQKLKLPNTVSLGALTQPEITEVTDYESTDLTFPLKKMIKPLLVWGVFTFFTFWVFLTCSVRIGCWFSLVETNIFSCGLLSFFISLMTVASIGIVILLTYLHYQTQLPTLGFYATGLVLFVGNCIFIIITAKKILKCYWRSLVTLLIMTQTMGQVGTILALWVLAMILPSLLSLETIQNVWQQIPF